MPKKTTRTEDRWLTIITDHDIFIHKVEVKIGKTLRVITQEFGTGLNTAVGFDGTKETVTSLLNFRRQFEVDDKRFCVGYDKALERVQKHIDGKAEAAARLLTVHNHLQRLKNGVTYVREDDKPFTPERPPTHS